jgi:hypothetical protein
MHASGAADTASGTGELGWHLGMVDFNVSFLEAVDAAAARAGLTLGQAWGARK